MSLSLQGTSRIPPTQFAALLLIGSSPQLSGATCYASLYHGRHCRPR
jgi:hypothetical protein